MPGKEATCWGEKKWFWTLSQGKKKPKQNIHAAAWAKQVGTCGIAGVGPLLAAVSVLRQISGENALE